MTREEAIEILEETGFIAHSMTDVDTALDMAIEALEGVCFDEWCTDCKEYDTEKNCCPRFNRVIRGAMKRIPHDDGTLEVKVEDATKVGRVLISDDKHRGGLYYPDEDEPKGDDLISRAEAIDAIENINWYHQNQNKDMVSGANSDEHQVWYKAQDIYKALEAVPSANRPKDGDLISRADAIEALGEEPLVWCDEEYEIAERSQWRDDVEAIKSVPSADRPRPIDPTCAVDPESGVVPISACEPRGPKTIIYADRIYSERPKGRWHYSDGKPATIGQSFGVICDQCGAESEYCTNFCGECGADMRGDEK